MQAALQAEQARNGQLQSTLQSQASARQQAAAVANTQNLQFALLEVPLLNTLLNLACFVCEYA